MGMQEAVRSVFSNYVTFSGRACRSEYWWFILFSVIVGILLSTLDGLLFGYTLTTETGEGMASFDLQTVGILAGIWSLVTFLPSLAVAVRRLHDTGRSAWWLLLFFLPLIGVIVLIVWFATRGTVGPNDHGPDPIGPER